MLLSFKASLALTLASLAIAENAAGADSAAPATSASSISQVQVAQPTTEQTDAARAGAARAKERAKQTKINVHLPTQAQDREKLRQLAEQAKGRGLETLATEAARRKSQSPLVQISPEDRSRQPAERGGLLIVALSSSLPDRMVRDYMQQLDGIPEALVVLRGFIGGAGAVTPTGKWVEQARRKDLARIDGGHHFVEVKVDPLVFRDLGITQVPAVAYLPGVKELRHCDEETLAAAVLVYGATTVSSALREIVNRGGTVPQSLIRKLEGI